MTPQIADEASPQSGHLSGRTLYVARRELPSYPPGETLLYWLGLAARKAREDAGVSMVEIAALLGMNTTKGVERFERAENWPLSLEWTLAAYGRALGIDGRDLIDAGMALWRERGAAPTLSPSEANAAAKAAAQAALEKESQELLAQQRPKGKATRGRKKPSSRKTPGAS